MAKYAIVRMLEDRPIRWGEFRALYLDHARGAKKQSTIRCSELPALRTFDLFAHNRLLSEITKQEAERWHGLIKTRFQSPHTVFHKIAVLRHAFQYAVSMGYLSENPFADIETVKPQSAGRVLSDREIKRLFAALPKDVRTACIVALYTGMRRKEVLAFSWDWLNGAVITIPKEIAKSGKARSFLLHPRVRRAIGSRRTGRVIPISESRLNSVLTKTWRRLGMGRIRFHDLRHTSATRYFEKTHDLFAMMRIYGWNSPTSALPYQHMTTARDASILRVNFKF